MSCRRGRDLLVVDESGSRPREEFEGQNPLDVPVGDAEVLGDVLRCSIFRDGVFLPVVERHREDVLGSELPHSHRGHECRIETSAEKHDSALHSPFLWPEFRLRHLLPSPTACDSGALQARAPAIMYQLACDCPPTAEASAWSSDSLGTVKPSLVSTRPSLFLSWATTQYVKGVANTS